MPGKRYDPAHPEPGRQAGSKGAPGHIFWIDLTAKNCKSNIGKYSWVAYASMVAHAHGRAESCGWHTLNPPAHQILTPPSLNPRP